MTILVGSGFPREKSSQIWMGKKLPGIVVTSFMFRGPINGTEISVAILFAELGYF